jgi:hypothetical protein
MQFNRIELHVKEAEFSCQLNHVFEVHTLTHASIQAAKQISIVTKEDHTRWRLSHYQSAEHENQKRPDDFHYVELCFSKAIQ